MKSYYELKAKMQTIQQQMVEANKYERTYSLKKVKRFSKSFVFTAGMLKVSIAEVRKLKRINPIWFKNSNIFCPRYFSK